MRDNFINEKCVLLEIIKYFINSNTLKMQISEELVNNPIIMISTLKEKYTEIIPNIQLDIGNSAMKIGYITVNKPFQTVIENLEKIKLNIEKFFFVDTITATVQTPPNVNNCIFVSSPTALTDLGLAFSSLFDEHECEIVIFDTISTLAVYQDSVAVTRFVHNLITKLRVLHKKAIFIALKEDSENLIKDLNMFVDKVVEL